MSRLGAILIAFLFILNLSAQTELTSDSAKTSNFHKNNFSQSPLKDVPDYLSTSDIQVKGSEADYYMARSDGKRLPLKLSPPSIYIGPSTSINTETHYPFANDYNYYGILYGFSDRAWISGGSSYNNYPTLGAVNSIDASFNYKVTDWMYVSAGAYGAKYSFHSNQYGDFGAKSRMKFIINERLRVNVFGQYSVNMKDNMIGGPLMNNMYPGTYYGGSIELKITDKFGLEGGVIREFNPFTRKWENQPYISPVFY